MSVTKAEMDAYRENLRTYQLRLCEWLGMNSSSVYRIDEQGTGATGPLDPPGLTVSWEATEMQPVERGHLIREGATSTGDGLDMPRYTGSVAMDWSDLRDLRAEVGERPEMPGLAAARAAFGM